MGYPSAYLSVSDEFGFCFTQAFQSIGLGLYTSIGAAKDRPDRLPVLGAGDGGFLLAISELESMVRERFPLVAIVYNDSAYGAGSPSFRRRRRGFGSCAVSQNTYFPTKFPVEQGEKQA
jgi:thiamine pyrophosphate-dependent acetolactate synthase large subunit-like protein